MAKDISPVKDADLSQIGDLEGFDFCFFCYLSSFFCSLFSEVD